MINLPFIFILFLFFLLFSPLLFKKEWYFLYLFPLFFSLSPRFSVLDYGGYRPVEIRLNDILLLAMILVLFMKFLMGKKYLDIKKLPAIVSIVFFVLILLLATVFGVFQGTLISSDLFLSGFYILKPIEYFLFFYFIVAIARKYPQKIKTTIKIFLIAALINAGWIFYQTFTNDYSGVNFMTKIMSIETYSQLSGGWGEKIGWGRPTLLFDMEPSAAGGYLMNVFALLLGLIFFQKQHLKYIFIVLIFLIALGFSLSRAGIICVFIEILSAPFLFFLISYKKFKNIIKANIYLVLGGIAVFLILLFLGLQFFTYYLPMLLSGGKYIENIYDPLGDSLKIRLQTFKSNLELWFQQPILGYGVGYENIVDNFYFWALINTGLLGLVALIAIPFSLFKHHFRQLSKSIKKEKNLMNGLLFSSMVILVGLFVNMFAFDTFVIIRVMEPFWFLQGLAGGITLYSLNHQNTKL